MPAEIDSLKTRLKELEDGLLKFKQQNSDLIKDLHREQSSNSSLRAQVAKLKKTCEIQESQLKQSHESLKKAEKSFHGNLKRLQLSLDKSISEFMGGQTPPVPSTASDTKRSSSYPNEATQTLRDMYDSLGQAYELLMSQRNTLAEENSALRAELSAIDPEFFEEIEDLKHQLFVMQTDSQRTSPVPSPSVGPVVVPTGAVSTEPHSFSMRDRFTHDARHEHVPVQHSEHLSPSRPQTAGPLRSPSSPSRTSPQPRTSVSARKSPKIIVDGYEEPQRPHPGTNRTLPVHGIQLQPGVEWVAPRYSPQKAKEDEERQRREEEEERLRQRILEQQERLRREQLERDRLEAERERNRPPPVVLTAASLPYATSASPPAQSARSATSRTSHHSERQPTTSTAALVSHSSPQHQIQTDVPSHLSPEQVMQLAGTQHVMQHLMMSSKHPGTGLTTETSVRRSSSSQ